MKKKVVHGKFPPDIPRSFYNMNNDAGVPEEKLPPSSQAVDFRNTIEYLNSTDVKGPEDRELRDKDPNWTYDGYYKGSSNYSHSSSNSKK